MNPFEAPKGSKFMSSIQNKFKNISLFVLNAYIIFWVAVLMYGSFNYYYLPVAYQDHPVYFRFRVCENGIGICSFPAANLSLIKHENQVQVFKRGQAYRIVMDIELPESDANKRMGMFMMEMKLYNRLGETLHTAFRSTTLHYKSSLLETMETLMFSPFFLFGYMSQKQTVHVEFFPNFVEYTYNPAVGVFIEIQSHLIQVYTAKLNIFTQFSGIRYCLYYWPITSAIVGISWIFIVLSFIVLLSWYQFHKKDQTTDEVQVLASIDMPWKRQPDRSSKRALVSPNEAAQEECETLGALPNDDDTQEETLLLLPPESSESLQESLIRHRRPKPET